jgi:Rrf2 family protein
MSYLEDDAKAAICGCQYPIFRSLPVFSQTVEYALRAVVQLAFVAPAPSTTAALAKLTQVPPAYLSKVLQSLVKAGIVVSQRGIGGGVSLARDPTRLTILDIVSAVDPIRRIRSCPLQFASHGTALCPLHRRLDAALEQIELAFAGTTLADILEDSGEIQPLCESGRRSNR